MLKNKTLASPGRLVIALDLLLLIALMSFAWYGHREALALATLYAAQNQATREAADAGQTDLLLTDTTEARGRIHSAIVDNTTLPAFIDQLEKLGTVTGAELRLDSATPGDKANPNIRLELTAVGSFAQIWHLSGLLDTLPETLKFTRSEFNQDQGANKKGSLWQLRASLELINLKTK